MTKFYFCGKYNQDQFHNRFNQLIIRIEEEMKIISGQSILKSLLAATLLVMSLNLSFAQVSADAGKTLFTSYCASCHAKNMKTALTGPALGGAQERWGNDADLYAWIRNSQAMIQKGNPKALELWNQYKPTVMNSFEQLTDDEIGSLLAYINGVYDGSLNAPKGGPVVAQGTVVEKKSNNWLYWVLAAFLAGLSYLLFRIIGNLKQLSAAKQGMTFEKPTLWQTLRAKGVVGILLFALVILGGYTTVNRAINLGRQQGYEPDQPIAFSHVTHAGENKIDCQYCHDGARRSKHSVIPATNTCMNCHRAIKVGSKYGTAEITKIYASIGYDPLTNTYIENYDQLSEDTLKAIYTAWMADSYITEKGVTALDAEGERLVASQWKNLVKALTNDEKKKIQGPIEWARIHGLPDHVYFNHAQHVSIGKVECQTCHGAVEKMEVVKQYSPLSMGWCVNCHRETEVKFTENPYYDSYERFHKELQEGKRSKVTVNDIGGLECQKCHY